MVTTTDRHEILQAPSGVHYAVGNAVMMGPGVYKEVKG